VVNLTDGANISIIQNNRKQESFYRIGRIFGASDYCGVFD
jgi:hypothetical protein